MGSRGAFVDVSSGDFSFKEGGQHYKSIGILSSNPNVKFIIQDSSNVKAQNSHILPEGSTQLSKMGHLNM